VLSFCGSTCYSGMYVRRTSNYLENYSRLFYVVSTKMIVPSNGLAVEDIQGIRDIGSSDREGVLRRLRRAVA